MRRRLPAWVLGFHGTDSKIVKEVLNDPTKHLNPSKNSWDWLGDGIYFWENDPVRAKTFAKERMRWRGIKRKKPAVIGAIIDLGLCLNLFDQPALRELKAAHDVLEGDLATLGAPMPKNEGKSADLVLRHLDQAVITKLHSIREAIPETQPYQTVRAGFLEGPELFPGTAFRAKNHIQIAVRDVRCIKGYFLPRDEFDE